MTAREMFDKYGEMKKERQMLSYQISHFTEITPDDVIEAMAFAHPVDDDVRVQTSGTSDKTASIAMNYHKIIAKENDDYYQFLVDKYEQLDSEIYFIDCVVKSLGGDKTAIVMEVLDKGLTWDQIADSYHVSRATVRRYRQAAIDELEKQYRIRERQDLQYMLS